MRILFSGYHNPHFHTITEYMENAIRNLGHELYVFDDRQHIVPGRIRKHVAWLNQLDLNNINDKLMALADKVKPDIVIITGGHRISSKAVTTIKDGGSRIVLWTIDQPGNFQPILDTASDYSRVFCQGTEAVELLDKNRIKGAKWLPVACDPSFHYRVQLSDDEIKMYGSDVVFVGSYYPNRERLFNKLIKFDFNIWGPGWEQSGKRSKLRPCVKGAHTSPSEWRNIYSASKIILTPHFQDADRGFPVYQASPRVFEALACGAFVISDKQRDVLLLYNNSEHLVCFENQDDLVSKIEYYLMNPDKRDEISKSGNLETLTKHTYEERIKTLLSADKY